MQKWWNCLRGYVIITIEGVQLERFINRAMVEGIDLWSIRRTSRLEMRASICSKDFNRLRKIARETRCRVHIQGRKGVPFFLLEKPQRRLIAFGAVVAVVVWWLFTSMIWGIDVVGASPDTAQAIREYVQQQGVGPGRFQSSVDKHELEKNLMLSDLPIAWAGVSLRGVSLVVEVVPSEPAPDLGDYSTPTRVVASKDAVIDSIVALHGQAVMQPGDTVQKGQEIISGYIEYENRDPLRVHAHGEVIGRVWYTKSIRTSLSYTQRVDTGRTATRRVLHLGGQTIAVDGGDAEDFALQRTETTRQNLFGEGLFLPAYYEVTTLYEQQEQHTTPPREQLEREAQLEVWELLRGEIPQDATIVERSFSHIQQDGELITEVTVETRESIAQLAPLER